MIEITDEEVYRYCAVRAGYGGGEYGANKAALTDFLANRPESTLGKLRPIAEMPEKPPEGCVRMFVYRHASGCFGGPFFIHSTGERFNFFADIQLPTPDPEAEERQRFEEALKAKYPAASLLRDNDGDYISDATSYSWDGFKIHAELAKAK